MKEVWRRHHERWLIENGRRRLERRGRVGLGDGCGHERGAGGVNHVTGETHRTTTRSRVSCTKTYEHDNYNRYIHVHVLVHLHALLRLFHCTSTYSSGI